MEQTYIKLMLNDVAIKLTWTIQCIETQIHNELECFYRNRCLLFYSKFHAKTFFRLQFKTQRNEGHIFSSQNSLEYINIPINHHLSQERLTFGMPCLYLSFLKLKTSFKSRISKLCLLSLFLSFSLPLLGTLS